MENYEISKLKWMQDHNKTIRDLAESMFRHLANYVDTRDDMLLMDIDAFLEDWEKNAGIDGEIWPCEAEWEDCEKRLPELPQTVTLPIRECCSALGTLGLNLTARENRMPEFGPEITVELTDQNGVCLQDLALIREKTVMQRNAEDKSVIEVLLWKDETSEEYTSMDHIEIAPCVVEHGGLENAYKSEDLMEKCPDRYLPALLKQGKRKLTPEEALAVSADKGKVDMTNIIRLTGMDEQDLKKALKGKIYALPGSCEGVTAFVTAGEYLSGTPETLKERLLEAENAAERCREFDENIYALRKSLGLKGCHLDRVSKGYLADIGALVDQTGMIHVSSARAQYMGDSVTVPGAKSWLVPSLRGTSLLIEGKHFIIEEEKGKE